MTHSDYTTIANKLAESRIPFSVHYPGKEGGSVFTIAVEERLTAAQLEMLTELKFGYSGTMGFMRLSEV